ncbi:response regulator [Lichenibacterium dinghuense]|uniref:response regulator n=1 Tax=Lichenibacterium dinghuense TaxID=2895977 RepID=UPI001F1F7B77|nr:response regulator [Lichenibacterium sp. 6Y81]
MTHPPKASLAQRQILLAEDEYFIMQDLRSGLQALGATVVGPAPSVAGALALIAGAPRIDAAVLDINLRGETIYPVADMLSARGIPFLFATGYSNAVIDEPYRGVPACEKPIDMRELARLLVDLLPA